MESGAEQVVIVEEVKSDGNPFILFIFFLLTLAIHYLIPLLGTIYAEKQSKKWIAYWIILLPLNYILKPIISFCFGVTGAAFLHLVIGVGLLYVCNQEKVMIFLFRQICLWKLETLPFRLLASSMKPLNKK